MRKHSLAVFVAVLGMSRFLTQLRAEDNAANLIGALASEKVDQRAVALEALKKLGDAATAPLVAAEADQKLAPRQLLLVRRILGDRLTETTTLKPVDLSKLVPFGADKAKGIAGNPDLLLDRATKLLVMNGEFVLEQGPLEYLVVVKHPNAKTHETVTAVYPTPRDICYALLACEYTYAAEVSDDGTINLPREAGILISVEYEWEPVNAAMGGAPGDNAAAPPNEAKNQTKKWVRVPIEFFAWNSQTQKTMKRSPFAFTGSKFERGEGGKMDFMADIEKSVVALKFDSYALMNTLLDTKNVNPYHAAGYAINRYDIPQRGTKCRVIFEPWSGGALTAEELKDTVEGKATNSAPPPTRK